MISTKCCASIISLKTSSSRGSKNHIDYIRIFIKTGLSLKKKKKKSYILIILLRKAIFDEPSRNDDYIFISLKKRESSSNVEKMMKRKQDYSKQRNFMRLAIHQIANNNSRLAKIL